jgi:hypothetical protein
MKDETKTWISYAGENLESARILYAAHLYNPCLQNVLQAVEKTLFDRDGWAMPVISVFDKFTRH